MTGFELGEMETRLLHTIYEAALAPEKWRTVLASISDHIGADEGSLIFHDAKNRTRNFLKTAVAEKKIDYLDTLIDVEIKELKQLFRGWRESSVLSAKDIIEYSGKPYEAIIGEAAQLAPGTALEVKAAIPLLKGNPITAAMEFHCHTGADELSPEAIQFLQRLAPHITRAIYIHNQVTSAKQKKHSLVESLKHINVGVFILDDNLHIVFSSPEASRMLMRHAALSISRSGELVAYNPQENIHLRESLRDLTSSRPKTQKTHNDCLSFALSHPGSIHPLKVSAFPLADDIQPSIRISVFINDGECPRIIPHHYLQQAYGFTVTESNIAQLLLNGSDLKKVAEIRNTSIQTARGQLKLLMQKTTTHSQAELLRLLMLLSGDFFDNKTIIPT